MMIETDEIGDERTAATEPTEGPPVVGWDAMTPEAQEQWAARAAETPGVEAERLPVEVGYSRAVAPVAIRLAYPLEVTVGSVREKIKKIDLLPPAYGDILAVTKGEMSRAELVAAMAGVPVEVVNGLRMPDAERVISAALDMTPDFAQAIEPAVSEV
ncbi:hypothetical protein [Afifella sp. YEN Y35]|uniref:hypothetical protein n=1 Tax=Afifella sp. YEN Y35 TaxID=3388337 RepID=UPI0039E008BC